MTDVVTNLDHPWDVQFVSTSSGTWMIYSERLGRISAKQMPSGAPVLLGAGGALPGGFTASGEGGLLGLAIDPDFASNRFVYACYTTTSDVRLVRFVVNTFTAGALQHDANVVTGMPVNPSGRHSGCRPRFRPDANPPQLFVGTGDAAVGVNAQSPTSLGGKVLCIDRDGSACAGNPGGAFDARIYSWGHRNVQGIAFTPGGGGYSVEHGSNRDDEVNVLLEGDFGWNPVPGYNESVPMTRPGAVTAAWSSGETTIAPSGATIVTGGQWRGWDGALVMAVLKGKELRVVFFDDLIGFNTIGETFAMRSVGRLRSAVQGPDGNLYVSTDNGSNRDRILQVAPQ